MDLLNRVMIAGRLTRDPEVRETSSGKVVANLGLALDPPGGGGREGSSGAGETIYVDVVLWERTAETASQYLNKGSAVLIEGRLQMNSWEDRETGKTRRKLKVAGERMKFLNLAPAREERDQREDPASTRRRESARTGR
ncbi:MAG: single-stranded DNA-binding protein [Akkermansiaceae bacterium]|nr:single-stranded DNA-binding protein [Akkermansiaceae bacterium]